MKKIWTAAVVGLAMVALAAPAWAAAGDSWILNVSQLEGGGWTEHVGAGYMGASAWQASGKDGVRRAYWKLEDPTIPTTTELYTIEYFVPTAGVNNWQPIESRISGSAGEVWPIDTNIPWAGMWGTNHQYIGAYDPGTPGTWRATGPGPQVPNSTDYNAPGSAADSIYMWLHKDSWLYAKWDFGWDINNTVSTIRLTQVTPEPATLAGFSLLGLLGLRRRRGQ